MRVVILGNAGASLGDPHPESVPGSRFGEIIDFSAGASDASRSTLPAQLTHTREKTR